jgi:hypothetical protein
LNLRDDCVPVRVVDLVLGAKKLLLTGLVGVVAADLVAVLLGLEERREVETTPHLLTGKLTRTRSMSVPDQTWVPKTALPSCNCEVSGSSELGTSAHAQNVPLLANTVEVLVEAVGHDHVHADHIVKGLEATGRNVPLEMESSRVS